MDVYRGAGGAAYGSDCQHLPHGTGFEENLPGGRNPQIRKPQQAVDYRSCWGFVIASSSLPGLFVFAYKPLGLIQQEIQPRQKNSSAQGDFPAQGEGGVVIGELDYLSCT